MGTSEREAVFPLIFLPVPVLRLSDCVLPSISAAAIGVSEHLSGGTMTQ